MKNVGEFYGLKIWVPETGDVIVDQQSFNVLKSNLEQMFPMVTLPDQNKNLHDNIPDDGEVCSKDVCDYCVGCGTMSCNDYSDFNGRKLSLP